jgi:hypothetical protein
MTYRFKLFDKNDNLLTTVATLDEARTEDWCDEEI